MGFFASAISILQTLVVAIGAGLGVWGVINLMEGYGSDNPAARSQGIKQLMSGGGVILIGTQLIPLLSGLFGAGGGGGGGGVAMQFQPALAMIMSMPVDVIIGSLAA